MRTKAWQNPFHTLALWYLVALQEKSGLYRATTLKKGEMLWFHKIFTELTVTYPKDRCPCSSTKMGYSKWAVCIDFPWIVQYICRLSIYYVVLVSSPHIGTCPQHDVRFLCLISSHFLLKLQNTLQLAPNNRCLLWRPGPFCVYCSVSYRKFTNQVAYQKTYLCFSSHY